MLRRADLITFPPALETFFQCGNEIHSARIQILLTHYIECLDDWTLVQTLYCLKDHDSLMDVIRNCFYSSLPVVKAVAETVMRYYVVEYHANAHLTNHEDEN